MENPNLSFLRSIASLTIALVLAYGLFFLLHPFVLPLLIGVLLTVLSRSFYYSCLKIIHLPVLSALLTIIGIIIALITPLAFLITLLVNELSLVSQVLQNPSQLFTSIDHLAHTFLIHLGVTTPVNLSNSIVRLLDLLTSKSTLVVGSIVGGVATALLAMITTFYLLQSQEEIKTAVLHYSPLSKKDTEHIANRAQEVIHATITGNLTLVGLQSLASMVGFLLFGISTPVLLGVLYGISSLVPTIGTALVWVPISLFQYFQGNYLAALGIALWALCQVLIFDNFLGPRLIQRRAHLHPFLILLGVLGGVGQFGMVGIILGPTIIALGILGLEILYRSWNTSVKE